MIRQNYFKIIQVAQISSSSVALSKAMTVSLANSPLCHFDKLSYPISKTWGFRFSQSIKAQTQSLQQYRKPNQIYNIPPRITQLYSKKLLHIKNHPLCILKERITKSLLERDQNFEVLFESYVKVIDSAPAIVTVQNNFDILNFPSDHISRSPSDTYYLNENTLLRTHTSAHQVETLLRGANNFVVFGDVYRRDQIDKFHYPVFHQMEAVRVLGKKGEVKVDYVVKDLKETIEKIIQDLFGKVEMRWIDAYFPFTEPSFELEIFYENKWVEMLGCGVIHQFVMDKSNRSVEIGWAAGLGLERFAMKLFQIPDVRLFWSEDQRFISQFTEGQISEFKEFSKYPICTKDISLWIGSEYNPNDLYEVIREVGGDLVESVEEIDTFFNKKLQKTSKAYRIGFRSLERTLTNEQITKIQFQIRDAITAKLKDNVQLR